MPNFNAGLRLPLELPLKSGMDTILWISMDIIAYPCHKLDAGFANLSQ